MSRLGWPRLRSVQSSSSVAPHPRVILAALVPALLLTALLGVVGAQAADFIVNDTRDRVDADLGDPYCDVELAVPGEQCTLRAAIEQANQMAGVQVIQVNAGTYTLTRGGAQVDPVEPPEPTETIFDCNLTEGGGTEGDLDIVCPVTIVGAGTDQTIIQAGDAPFGSPPEQTANDRLIEIHPAAGNVTISGLTLRNGYHPEAGGALANASMGRVRLEHVAVRDSFAMNAGGGIYSGQPLEVECPEPCAGGAPRLELVDTVVAGNTTGNEGGGVYVQQGTLSIIGGSIADNHAMSGAGIFNAGEVAETGLPSSSSLSGVTISGNVATGAGGGIFGDHEGSIVLTDATLADNTSFDYGGGMAVVSKSTLSMTGGTVRGNIAVGDGGGVYTGIEGTVTITGVTFQENAAGQTLPSVEVPGEIAEGEGGGGGIFIGGSGPATVSGSDFIGNDAHDEGGGIFVENNGSVSISDGEIRDNTTSSNGGGIENAGRRVSLSHMTIHHNRATFDGGGISGNGSGDFTISDTIVHDNTAENGGGFSNGADGASRVERTTFWNNRAIVGISDDTGLGGAIYGLGDATAHYENMTVTGNFAQVRGGGMYIDADADVHVDNSTISRNVAPAASGIGDEATDFNVPIKPSEAVMFRNTIVAGNVLSPNCNFALGSLGGNYEDGDSCHFRGPRDRQNAPDAGLDAIADNGGPTMTMALRPDSFAIDGGVSPCPATDQRGIARPQNGRCDMGAFEFTGPFAPADTQPPDTRYLTGPIQDSEATSAFTFTGIDNVTEPGDLLFECRLIENDVAEPPEPVDPTEPIDPEFMWLGCPSPWQVEIIDEGLFRFEVRAIDRAGNTDPTPVERIVGGDDFTAPNTVFTKTPTNPSSGTSAVFAFSGTDAMTPSQWLEFECRIDSGDPAAWLECTSPIAFTNLSMGQHTVQVRAADGADNVDPTPATYTWTVQPRSDCAEANITLFADADAWIDEANTQENFGIDLELAVRSAIAGENARALVSFGVPTDLPDDCVLKSARLRLYSEADAGRTIEAVPVTEGWSEMQVNWINQPDTGGPIAATTSGNGYREWDVTDAIETIIAGTLPNEGFIIRDADEGSDPDAEHSFTSRHVILEPPETQMPQLVLRFDGPEVPVPGAPDAPQPAVVTCSQEITESTRVMNDLFDCPRDGLVIAAPDVELDLNGHTIDGLNYLLTGQEDGLPVGIRNVGHENVIIRNGTVQEFGQGVQLMAGARFNVVRDLVVQANAVAGIELWDADDGRNGNTIRNNRILANGEAGIWLLAGTEGALITENRFDGNAGIAIYLLDAHRNTIVDNAISGIVLNPSLDSDGGILLEGSSDNVIRGNTLAETGDGGAMLTLGSHRNVIEDNTFTRTGDAGVAIDQSDGNQVIGNRAYLGSDAGVVLGDANGSVVRDNDVRFNPTGVDLSGSSDNVITGNDASYSDGAGIAIGADSLRNFVTDNVASNTAAEGISVEGDAADLGGNPLPALGNRIADNVTNGNLGDGISVAGIGHTIAGNDANSNAAYGIAAEDQNVDGGGNTASDNGEAVQCIGVVCATGAAAPPPAPDFTAPETTILTTPPPSHGMLDTVSFTFTGSDNVAPPDALRFECRLDAPPDPVEPLPDPEPPEPGDPDVPDPGNWHECASPLTYYLLTAGEHRLEVRAIDPFENIDLTPEVHTWTVVAAPPGPDAVAPSTTIFDGPNDPTTRMTATFRFGGSDDVTEGPFLIYECRVDGGAYAACTTPHTVTGLGLGSHTFSVRAIDRAGNQDVTPATETWTIVAPPPDNTPPETTIASAPDLTTVSTVATFTFTGTDASNGPEDDGAEQLTFECSLDSAAFAACTSPLVLTDLGVGGHTLAVRAVDEAGLRDLSPATHGWSVTPPPVARSVTCGQVLTQSTLVTNNLVDCPADGLVIGAANITVDLDGHTIDGTALELAAGVRNNGFDSVTITNGIVQEFDYGVLLNPGTAFNVVSSMTAQLNLTAGIGLSNADDGTAGNIVRGNTSAGNDTGFMLSNGTQHALLLDNTVSGSAGFGIYLLGGNSNRIDGNLVTLTSDTAINLEGSSRNTLIGNTVGDASDASMMIQLGSNDNSVEGNTLTAGEAGVHVLDSSGTTIVDNVATAMSDIGIILENAQDGIIRGNDLRFSSGGIELSGSSGNLIEDNDASEGAGTGISLGGMSLDNVIVNNRANANDAEGIYVGDPAAAGVGNIIDNNTTNNNIADGIHVGNIGHVVARNTSNHNGGWGIYVATATVSGGNIDGGGNAAIGNVGGGLDPFTLLTIECFNIVCDGTVPLASDPVRPETWTIESPTNPSASTSATFTFGGIDNATRVRFECRLDSTDAGDFADCTSPMALSGLALGSHTFEVRAVDFSGNVDATPATHTWVVTAPPAGLAPVATLTATPDTATPSTGATFAFSANEADATFECRLDGAAFAPCASPRTYTALAVGAHTFEVRAVDAEGLVSAAVSWPWRITATPVPTAVTCGRVLTQSTLVTNDLHDCPGNGLVVGAHNITVDLGGHTIDGVQSGVGIQNNGFDSAVITNGSVQEFETGIRLNPGTTLNVISGMTFTMTKLGAVYLSDADRTTMRDLELTMNETGIVISAGSQNAVLRDSAIGLTAKQGVWISSSPGTLVENTTISASSEAGILLEGSTGTSIVGNRLTGIQKEAVAVTLGSHTTLIERNTLTGNAGGVRIFESNFALLLSNVIDGNDDGIFMEKSNDSVVRANDVRMNGGGIEAKDVNRTRFELNNVSGNSGSGIFLDGASIGNQLVLNVASGNDGEGIDIPASGSSSNRTVVDRNITNGNGSGGIFATGAHRLSNNQADFNDGWGIYAESGTVDGGGNNALGNSEPIQCVGVSCFIGINPSAPNTTILEHPTNPSNSRSASFLFTGTDDTTALVDIEFECRLDTTNELAWTECENPALYTNLAPGTHVFEVRALDIVENPDPTPAHFTWVYQPLAAGVAPDTTIEIAPPLGTPLFEAIFKFYANEPDVTFECSLDGAAFTACANEPEMIEANWFIAEYEFEEHEVGEHTFRVRARDFEGNVDTTPATHTWSILGALAIITDGPAFEPGDPGEPGEPPSGGETESRTATFVFHANIPDALFECSLDLAVYLPCASPVTYPDLAVGEHVFIVIAIDPEGEWVSMEEGSEYEWTILPSVDQEPPTTLILDGPDSGTGDATVTFIGGDDVTSSGGLTFECRLDSVLESDWFECISPLNLLDQLGEPLAAGPHTIDVRAVDLEDNVDPTPARHSWTAIADTVAPNTELLTHPAASVLVDVDVTFTFAGADNATSALGLTFECSLDGAEYEACESPHEVQGTEPGEHTMRVRAVDMALNVDATPAEWTWLVIGAPDTTLDSSAAPPAAPAVTTDTSALFTFTADQAGSTFGCALNGSEFTRCASPLELLGLGGGAYLLEVQATNEFGLVEDEPAAHEWIVDAGPDTTTPETAISSGPPAETTATTATISFVSSELGSSFECALVPLEPDAVANFSSCTSPFQATELPGGEHTFLVRAMDLAGNVDPTPDEWSWTVAAPPITTIVTGPEDGTESSVATFTFVSSVAGAQFYCALDVPPFEPCTSPVTYAGIGIGDHEFVVYSVAGGFADTDGDGWEWGVVVDAPINTGITAGPPSIGPSPSATFEFASTEAGSTFECALDGGPWVACTSPRTVSGLGLGSHTFAVRAIGPSGEVDATPATATWEIVAPDVTAPNTLITEAPPATTDQLDASFRFASTETGSIFACSLDGEAPEPCVSPFVILDLEVGGHVFTVAATDAAGNTDPTPAEHPWTIVADTVAPETIIVDGPTGIIGDNVAAVTFTGSDNVTLPIDLEFECSLNGEPFGGCDSPTLLEDLAVGPHTFAVRAIDDADVPNVDPTPATIEWTVLDTIAPETSIDSGPEDPTDSATATFTFSGEHLEPTTDPSLTFACSLDAGDFVDCASPSEITVGIGLHTFDVRAIDGAGNADATPERYEWTALGPDAPDTFIDAAPDETIQGELALFAFSSNLPEMAVEFECSLDEAPYESCESPHELEGLAIGDYLLAVRAVDELDRVDLTPATHSWSVVAPPVPLDTGIESGPANPTEETSATFVFTASRPEITEFECSLNGSTWTGCESPHELTDLSVGLYTLEVRAVDEEGNVDDSPATWSWEVQPDSTPLDTEITSGPDATTPSTLATFSFISNDPATFECALDGTSFSSCVAPHTVTDLSAGEHTLLVRAKSLLGAFDETPASRTWTVEDAPVVTIESAPDAQTESTSATFSFSADVPGTEFECALDNAELFTPCDSPVTYAGLALFDHEFRVQARVPAHHVEPEAATHTWEIGDLTAPIPTITSGPDDVTTSTTATFTFEADEPDASFQCALDGALAVLCTSPYQLTGLAVGEHELEVLAANERLLVEPISVTISWTVEPPNTPAGTNVTVETIAPDGTPATITFDSVEVAGDTTVSAYTDPPALPANYLQVGSRYYDLETTAAFDGTATVCLPAADDSARLLHYVGGEWVDVTAAGYPAGGIVCGDVTSFSPFAVASVDLTAPATSINAGPPATTESTAASISFSADDPAASFECALDGAAFAPCTSPQAYASLAIGAHSFAVRATDAAGNTDASPAVLAWTITAPPPPVVDCGTTATLTASADSWIDQNQSGNNGNDQDLSVRSRSGNRNHRTLVGFAMPAAPSGCVVESAVLRVHARSSASGRTLQALRLTGAWTESGVRWNNQPATAGTAATTTSGNGYREWNVTALVQAGYDTGVNTGFLVRDAAENGSGSQQEFSSSERSSNRPQLVLRFAPAGGPVAPPADTTAPDTTISVGPPATGTSTSASLTFTATESGSTFACALDGAAYTACTSPRAYTNLAVGSHTFAVRATDAAGNTDGSPATRTWTITAPPQDTTAPDTTIASGPSGSGTATTASFTFSATEAGSTFACSLDGATHAPCTSPQAYSGLAIGSHTFSVRATDAAGNTDASPATRTWTVTAPPQDTTAPDTIIASGPSGSVTATTASFAFSATETGSTFACSLDGATHAPCTSPQAYTNLAVGSHTFSVRATDAAGNADASPATRSWTVTAPPPPDTTAPDTTIASGPSGSVAQTTASFAFSSTETGSSFACSLDAAAYTSCTTPQAYSGLAVGAHSFAVRATDAAGNTDASPATRSWTVTAPPVVCSTTTLTATADAWIEQNSPGNNKGTDSTLKVRSKGPADNARALVSFTLPAAPAGCVLEAATLRIYSDSPKSGRTLHAIPVAGSWTEQGVTWTNQPATTGTPASTTTASSSGYRDWIVTPQVQAQIAGPNHGFLIRDATEGQDTEQSFHSREKGDNRPLLVLRWVAAPPAGGLIGLGAGCAGDCGTDGSLATLTVPEPIRAGLVAALLVAGWIGAAAGVVTLGRTAPATRGRRVAMAA